MKELLELILTKSLPEGTEINVTESADDFGETVYEIQIPEEFRGRIIGKAGKNIQAIRQLTSVIARQQNKRVHIKIID